MQASLSSQGLSASSPLSASPAYTRVKVKPNADKTSTTSTTVDPPRRVFLRRRRSRSSESRKSRKDTGQTGSSLHSKKRKTSSAVERPPSSPVDPKAYPAGPSWRSKDHKRRSSEPHRPLTESRRVVSERRANVSCSEDENYETSHSTLPDIVHSSRRHKSLKPAVPSSRSVERSQEHQPTLDIAKKQISELKMSIEHSSKIISNQNQIIEKLKQDLAAMKKMNRKQAAQLEKLKTSGKQAEEMLRIVQSNIQCQICLEPMTKPNALAPCGHVLCQSCLQEWFRSPISQGHQDEDPEDRIPTIYRRKLCPCCRAQVLYRPLRIYTLSSIIAGVTPQATNPPPNPNNADADEDPWKDIFSREDVAPNGYEIGDMTEDDFDDDEVEALYGDGWSLDIASSDESDSDISFGYGSDSDDSPYEGNYVRPPWSPPTLEISREGDPRQSDQDLRLLRRGATLAMIRLFRMTWDSSRGIVARNIDSDIYLGWNIELDEEDDDGEIYMEWILSDIVHRPDRWDIFTAPNGRLSAIKLIREDIAEALEHAREIYNERRMNSSR